MNYKKIAKDAANLLPTRITNSLFAIKHRIWWKTRKQEHLFYFDEYVSRYLIKEVLRKLIDKTGMDTLRIIEFGCSGGNNLRLMRESIGCPISYCGLDIQANAITFARRQFPQDIFYVCDDITLTELFPQLGHYDVFLASAVLYYIPQLQVQRILELAAQMAAFVLVIDYLNRFNMPNGSNNGLFIHPYATMCNKAGLEVIRAPTQTWDDERHDYFLASSADENSHLIKAWDE